MKPANIAKAIKSVAFDPLETLNSELASPFLEEAANELGGFFGNTRKVGRAPKEIAGEDLKRARDKKNLDEMAQKDESVSRENAQRLFSAIQQEYRVHDANVKKEQSSLKAEMAELTDEVVKLAKAAGVDTKAHLSQTPKKIGVLDIKWITSIIRSLRIKAEESKDAQELVTQRSNAKQSTGMLAWVSGKQMKVHEQGTLQLQG